MPDTGKSYKAKVNDFEFQFTEAMLDKADLVKISTGKYHVIKDSRSIAVIVHDTDKNSKKLRIEIEGEFYEVVIKDTLDQVLDNMGFNNVSTRMIKEIKAPMPGLVLDIAVSVGDELKEGDRVLILEAMKMENSIVMHAEGKIKKINVKKGQPVEKGQVMVEIE